MTKPQSRRCAIYTRKSTEEGLEQDFNSLQAQHEACAAYIASQKHEGWKAIKTQYDDGGFSGGNMERPALRQLLADIAEGKVDVIVVYKVDRLSRSLHDFARMVEIFDKHSVSFVSVTQQFNTTTSMGRLTLNVLLSFAQFEREVTGERIRDKIAASKQKGMWMGGNVPLGYDVKDRKLIINTEDAKTARHIFQRYLDMGCVRLLYEDLRESGIRSKLRGKVLSRGTLYKMLSNPIYIGQIRHKGINHPGLHDGIISQELWDQVQRHMADNRIGEKGRPRKTEASPLVGKLFDVSGERLVPVHATKRGRRYRYYVSQSATNGKKDISGWRLPGQEIEQTVMQAASQLLQDGDVLTAALREKGIETHTIQAAVQAAGEMHEDVTETMDRLLTRVELLRDGIRLTLSLASLIPSAMGAGSAIVTHDFPMAMKRRGVEMRLVISGPGATRPDARLIDTIVHAHGWLEELLTGKIKSIGALAVREHVDKGTLSRIMNLAFLAPEITRSITTGRQPADLNTEKLLKQTVLPLDWIEQKRLLGFV